MNKYDRGSLAWRTRALEKWLIERERTREEREEIFNDMPEDLHPLPNDVEDLLESTAESEGEE